MLQDIISAFGYFTLKNHSNTALYSAVIIAWVGQTRLVLVLSITVFIPLQKHSQLVSPAPKSRRSVSLNSSISARLTLNPPHTMNTALRSPFSAGIMSQRRSINLGSYAGVSVTAHANSVRTLCSSDDPPLIITSKVRKWRFVTCERNGRVHYHLVRYADACHLAGPHHGLVDDFRGW